MAGVAEVLRIEDLRIAFSLHGHDNEVVRGVTFRIPRGRTVALVGESGSGKSVISQAVMGLLPRNGRVTGGTITFHGDGEQPAEIASLARDGPEMRKLRGGHIGMIFQEPMSSLSPVHTIGNQIQEARQLHRKVARSEARATTERMLKLVGFKRPQRAYDMYSFELSGGLRQRAMLAMALICQPALLIADEPTTALDVTIQAQVLDLLAELKERLGMAIMLITHAMGVVAEVAQRVVVMYAGMVVEEASVEALFANPRHPYTQGLIRSIPRIDTAALHKVRLEQIPGTVPKLIEPADGCRFAPRCKHAVPECTVATPALREPVPGHKVRCIFDIQPGGAKVMA
jgi:oligopeptide/dipeptide ABC transporter ATP-binding protein